MKFDHFMIDIETTGIFDYPVILSLAIVPFNLDEKLDSIEDLERLKSRSLYLKFYARDQINRFGFTTDPETMEWWKNQSEESKVRSLYHSVKDVKIDVGWQQVLDFVVENRSSKKALFWSRGSFEPSILDPMAKKIGLDPIHFGWFSQWSELRTALRILYGSDRDEAQYKEGVKIDFPDWKGLWNSGYFKKHDPLDDSLLDIVFLLKGQPLE